MKLPRARAECVKSGFTLLELMVVIVLVGIMTAMILPDMRGTYEDALLRSTSRKLVSALQLANTRAITVSRPHRLRLDQRVGRYFIEARDGTQGFRPARDLSNNEGELDRRIAIEIIKQVQEANVEENASRDPLPAGRQKQTMDRETISFYPDGTAESCQVQLRDRQGFRLGLRVNALTARVQVVQLPRE